MEDYRNEENRCICMNVGIIFKVHGVSDEAESKKKCVCVPLEENQHLGQDRLANKIAIAFYFLSNLFFCLFLDRGRVHTVE